MFHFDAFGQHSSKWVSGEIDAQLLQIEIFLFFSNNLAVLNVTVTNSPRKKTKQKKRSANSAALQQVVVLHDKRFSPPASTLARTSGLTECLESPFHKLRLVTKNVLLQCPSCLTKPSFSRLTLVAGENGQQFKQSQLLSAALKNCILKTRVGGLKDN